MENFNNVAKNNIVLYEGYNPNVPMRVWVVHIPVKDNSIKILVLKIETDCDFLR